MSDIERLISLLKPSDDSTVLENYILPGMRSTMLGKVENGSKIRLFEMQRDQEVEVTPHDHRYDFQCFVISGRVVNRVYRCYSDFIDAATHVSVPYDPKTHALDLSAPKYLRCNFGDSEYKAGDWYSMGNAEYHAIRFSKGSKVLFVEGADVKPVSSCLLPFHNGQICNTFMWADWMMAPKEKS